MIDRTRYLVALLLLVVLIVPSSAAVAARPARVALDAAGTAAGAAAAPAQVSPRKQKLRSCLRHAGRLKTRSARHHANRACRAKYGSKRGNHNGGGGGNHNGGGGNHNGGGGNHNGGGGKPRPRPNPPTRYPDLEQYALFLVNCVRGGGLVRDDGTCNVDAGSGPELPRLEPNTGLARHVARPYANRLAQAGACTHTLNGSSVDSRFRKGGFRGDVNGESLGCAWGWSVKKMVLETHLMMQRERTYGGPHWRNLRDPDWTSVGIGIGSAGTTSRIVYDFYGH